MVHTRSLFCSSSYVGNGQHCCGMHPSLLGMPISTSCGLHVSPPMLMLGTRVYNKQHMYDATEIFRTLPQHQKEAYFKIAFYLLSFFYYLYRCAAAIGA